MRSLKLSLDNVEIAEDDKMSDPDLLMSILETREALEAAQSEDEMLTIREENKGK